VSPAVSAPVAPLAAVPSVDGGKFLELIRPTDSAARRHISAVLRFGDGLLLLDAEDALEAVDQFSDRSGVPRANVLLESEGHVEVVWTFDADVDAETSVRMAGLLNSTANLYELVIDSAITRDAERMPPTPGAGVTLVRCDPPLPVTTMQGRLADAAERFRSYTITSEHRHASSGLTQTQLSIEARRALGSLPANYPDTRSQFMWMLAVIDGLEIPDDDKINLAYELASRSERRVHMSRAEIAALMKGTGVITGFSDLVAIAEQFGYVVTEIAAGGGRSPYLTKQEAVTGLVDRYSYLRKLDLVYDHQRQDILKPAAFRRTEMRWMPKTDDGKPYDPLSLLTGSLAMRELDGVINKPGAPNPCQHEGRLYANQFAPHDPEPLPWSRKERRMLHRYIRHMFPTHEDRKWLWHFWRRVAYLRQHPGERIRHMLLLVGKAQGTGKSMLMVLLLRALFGSENVSTPSQKDIESQFNGFLRKWLVSIGETSLASHSDHVALDARMKPWTTEDNASVRLMFQDSIDTPLFCTFFGDSNDTLRAAIVGEFNRRLCVHETKAGRLPDDLASELGPWLRSPRGASVLMWMAMGTDTSKVDPWAEPPMTLAKQRMLEAQRHPVLRELIDGIQDAEFPFDERDLVTADDIRDFLLTRGVAAREVTHRKVADLLQLSPINATRLGNQKRVMCRRKYDGGEHRYGDGGRRYRVWALRDAEHWQHASESDISRHFETGAKLCTVPNTAAPPSQPAKPVRPQRPLPSGFVAPLRDARKEQAAATLKAMVEASRKERGEQ
jgi:hypothetical protein